MHKFSDDLALFDFTSLSLKMDASHKGEEGGIRYLSLMECEEKPYKLRVDTKTQILYRSIDRKKSKPHKLPNGLFLYIVSPQGELYLIKEPVEIDIFQRHSSLNGGGDVLCAGKMVVKDGKIISMDNASGHYKPDTRHLHIAAIYLYQQKILMSDCSIQERSFFSYEEEGSRISLTLENLLKISPYLYEYEQLTHTSKK